MKKHIFLTAILVVLLLFASVTSFAEDVPVSVNIDDMIEDKEGWVGIEELTFENGSVTHNYEKAGIISNKNFTFLNELISFKLNVHPDVEKNYNGRYILLRAKKPDAFPYGKGANDCYLFVLSDTQIELQRWINTGSEFLSVVRTPITHGEYLITCGAINTPEGVHIVLYINGELVISELDKSPGILRDQKGYLAFHNSQMQTISSVGEDIPALPIASDFKISGSGAINEEIKATYSFLDVNGNEEKGTKITWYTSTEDFKGKSLSTKVAVPNDGMLLKIEGAEGESYTPKPDDVAKYIYAGIEPSSESGTNTVYLSNAIYIDPAIVTFNSNICMVKDEQMAYVFGECRQIDKEDPYIIPEKINEKMFVPLRFVVEALGGNILWNSEARIAEAHVNGNTASFPLGEAKMLLNGEEKALEGASYILYGRTMVPVDALKEFCGKYVYASNNGIVLIGNYENKLDFDTNAELYNTIYKTIRQASYAQ